MTLRQFKSWVQQQIANLGARWARVAASSAVRVYELEGRAGGEGEEGADEEPYQDAAVMYQHYGFRSRPGAQSEVISVACGGTSQRTIIASEVPGTGPLDQEDGEVEIYSQHGQRIRLMVDGSVVISDSSGGTATLAAGRLTVSQDVAREHDLGTGATPSCVAAPPLLALANASTAILTGTDRLCRVTLTVAGANPAPAGTALFVATFARAYTSGAMALVAQESGDKKYTYSVSNSTVTVTAGETIATGTTLVFVVSSGGLA